MDRSPFPPEHSRTGRVTLDAFSQAPRFNRWMYEALRPWTGDRVAELGAGTGNLSAHFVHHPQVFLSDHLEEHVALLWQQWGHARHVQVHRLDMTVAEDLAKLAPFAPDTVVFTNVLEHIADDRAVLRDLHALVPKGCRLVVLVPYDMKLYSAFDREVGHFRRYGKGELELKMQEAGFTVEQQRFFNKPGRLAWFLALKLGGQRRISPLQLRLYDRLTSLFRIWDKVIPGAGASTIVVARRN